MTNRLGLLCLVCAVGALAGCGPAVTSGALLPGPPQRPEPQTPPSTECFLYVAQRGDTLYGLQQRFKVPWQEILKTNNVEPSGMKIGTLLFIRRVAGVTPPRLTSPPAVSPAGHAARRALGAEALHRGRADARYWWPTQGTVVQRFGQRLHGLAEPGIAIAAPAGTDVCAVADGTVKVIVPAEGSSRNAWGNVVTVSHAGKVASWYAHLDTILVRAKQKVRKGQVLGSVGSTGAAQQPRLALRLFQDERPVNPEDHLP